MHKNKKEKSSPGDSQYQDEIVSITGAVDNFDYYKASKKIGRKFEKLNDTQKILQMYKPAKKKCC